MSDSTKILLAVIGALGFSFFAARRVIDQFLPDIKAGVNIDNLKPVMNDALVAVGKAAQATGAPNVVTSGNDGIHMAGSLHFTNEAIDARRADWPNFLDFELASQQADIIRQNLSDDFDVILEDTHIHIEFDPRMKSAVTRTRGKVA